MCCYLAARTRVAPLWSRGASWYVPEKAANLLPQLTTREVFGEGKRTNTVYILRKLLWKPSTPHLPHKPQPWKTAAKLWLTASAHIYHNWRSVQVDVHAWAPHEQDNTKKITSKTQCCVCVGTRGLATCGVLTFAQQKRPARHRWVGLTAFTVRRSSFISQHDQKYLYV